MKMCCRKIRYWKRILLLLAVALLTGCGQKSGEAGTKPAPGQSDLEYVTAKGTLVVGITDYAPMDYLEGGSWKGFDAELSRRFADSLGVQVELKEIDWEQKTKLLADGTIDCIWNGMTMTDELKQVISCSDPYLSNAQVVVLHSSEMEKYQTMEECRHLLFAAEGGSTGAALLQEKKHRYSIFPTQMEALQGVRDQKVDAAVIDIIMASYYIGSGQEFDDLDFDIALNDEKICIGFRADSDLTQQANTFLKNGYADGTIAELAERYGIESALLD